ncbi:MAG: hypothetical protein LUC99_05025 [Clostridiales bacterium]|nr:hypothetical protein [Clostridiales bacterium]
MKTRLVNNLGLKILSVFLAFFIWLLVVNVSNPEISDSQDVTLEIENGDILTDAERTYEISRSTVAVVYDVHTLDEYKIRASDFRAYVDLSELYSVTGSVEVKVEVLNNSSLIRNVTARPSVVRVETEDLQTKVFELQVRTEGTVASGYALNSVTLEKEIVTLRGPVSQVGQVSSAGVEINIDGYSGDYEGTAVPVFYDANGNEINLGSRVTADSEEIGYTLVINNTKDLPLDFEVSGTVANGYRYTGADANIRSVQVTGLKSALASVDKVTIPNTVLNVAGAYSDVVVNVDLRDYLPDGVQLVDNQDPIVEIRLRVEQLITRTITLAESDILLFNSLPDLDYRLTPSRFEVTLQGLEADLEGMSGSDLRVSINVSGLGIGTHTGTLRFETEEEYAVVAPVSYTLEITESGPGSSDDSEEPEEDSDDSELSMEVAASVGETVAETEPENMGETTAEAADGTAARSLTE